MSTNWLEQQIAINATVALTKPNYNYHCYRIIYLSRWLVSIQFVPNKINYSYNYLTRLYTAEL